MPPRLIEEYIRNDSERANALPSQYQCVYDCIEYSPFYENDETAE